MSVLARPHRWFVRSPLRRPGPAELSPLSAASAGSTSGNEGDAEVTGRYGGSLIMVQHECDTERAAEAEDEERLCSVVLNPLPSALLHSLGARGHVRMRRPPAAATSWPPSPTVPLPPLPRARPVLPRPRPRIRHNIGKYTYVEPPDEVRALVRDLVRAVESDDDAPPWPLEEVGMALQSPEQRHRKKHRKVRRESHDSEGKRKRRKRSTSSSSGSHCTTPAPPRIQVAAATDDTPIQVAAATDDTPRVNPIFVWVTQSEESTITQVLCEDYDKRNRIRLTKTPNGWRAIPRTERLAVLQPNVPQDDAVRSPSPNHDVTLDLSPSATQHSPSPPPSCVPDDEVSLIVEDPPHELTPADVHVQMEDETVIEEVELEDDDEEISLVLRFDDDEPENITPDELQDVTSEELSHVTPDELQLVTPDVLHVTSDELKDVTSKEIHVTSDVLPEVEDVAKTETADEISKLLEDDVEKLEILETELDMKVEDLCKRETSVKRDELNDVESEPLNEETPLEETKFELCEERSLKPDLAMFEDDIKIEPEKLEGGLEIDESDLVPKKDEKEDEEAPEPVKLTDEDTCEPPPAHASSLHAKAGPLLEPAADLSQRRRNLNDLLPCRSPLRLPPLLARPLPSPVAQNGAEPRTPNPAHQQQPCILPSSSTALCGSQDPTPAHQHDRNSPFLENLLSQQPLSLESKRPSGSRDPPAKRRRSEDITLRNLLGGATPSGTPEEEKAAPRSRLLELLTTSAPPRVENKRKSVPPPLTPSPDALAQLRHVLAEVAVPDPLLVPRSRLAALLASPAVEIPRLLRSPPSTAPDTLAVSISRLQAILKRSDSELLTWAAQDWAIDSTVPPNKSPKPAPKVKTPSVIPKVPVTKSSKTPVHKTPTSTSELSSSSLAWWMPRKPPMPPPPPSPDILAAFHAMYGSALLQPNYFAPPFPNPHELALWPGVTLTEAAKPPPQLPPPQTKPRIACKSLLELLANKPQKRSEAPPALDLAPSLSRQQQHQQDRRQAQQQQDRRQAQHQQDRRQAQQQQQQQQQQSRDCPRLWHPLFGSQKSNTWNWKQVAVHGD